MAATKDRLKRDLAAALRAKDEAAKMNIRMMMGAITVAEVAGDTARAHSFEPPQPPVPGVAEHAPPGPVDAGGGPYPPGKPGQSLPG